LAADINAALTSASACADGRPTDRGRVRFVLALFM
jgi:hypothetical protein